METHRKLILFWTFYLLLATSYLIPPNVNFLYWTIGFKALARIIFGFFEFLVFVVLSFFGGETPFRLSIGLLVLGFPLGFVFIKAWQKKLESREILLFCLLFNSGFGLFAVSSSGILVKQPVSSCQQTLSENNQVKLVIYTESGLNPGAYYFFTSSHNSGKSWEQIFVVHLQNQITNPCQNYQAFSEQMHWFWMGWQFAVTHDNGDTWQVWGPENLWPTWKCCDEYFIQGISFDNSQLGVMNIQPPPSIQAFQLITQDGGLHWQEP